MVMAVLLALAAFPQSSLFTLETIAVAGATTLSADAVVAASGLRRGQRLFTVDATAVASRLRAHPRIKSAVARVRPPRSVIITIAERRPVIALVVGDQFALLDQDLIVVTVAGRAEGVPEVEDRIGEIPWPRPGTPVLSDGVRAALVGLRALPPELQGLVKRVVVAVGPDLTFVTNAGLEIRAGGLAGLAERLQQVPRVLEALRARRMAVSIIDLRYAGSIVVKPLAGGDVR